MTEKTEDLIAEARAERDAALAECRTLRGERNTFEDDLAKEIHRADAALAAVERVRAAVKPWGSILSAAKGEVLAALDGAPEPETPELFPGTNAALDRLTVRKAAPAEAFCIEHGNFHAVELGDPTCEFEDGFGEPVDGERS